ncbi:MAG TPA: type II CAAX endopeptidase family protein [Opitutus sp.]|nr:type II CAAX endopeptidase family protein [Opitutus sp.]
MPDKLSDQIVSLVELLLLLVGILLIWRHVLSPSARARRRAEPPPLPLWTIRASDFLLFALLIVAGGLVGSFVAGAALAPFKVSRDTITIVSSAAFQLGLLLGAAIAPLGLGHPPLRPGLDRAAGLSGVATFLIALPIVAVASLAWLGVLKLTGLPAEQQDLLRMFAQADSLPVLTLLIVLATVVAPMAEELLFRATLFRYLRGRLPRWIALLGPGMIFASLHVNWVTLDGLASFVPLTTLAVVFSLAYERTGRIATAIVAHAIFNLHTILLLFAGVTA